MSLQVRTLLEEEEEVAVVTAHQLAEVLPWCTEETRDQMLISELRRAVERCGERQDLLASLLSCFTVISELQEPGQSQSALTASHLSPLETILTGFVLPALTGVLDTVSQKYPHLECSVLTIISQIEATRTLPTGVSGSEDAPMSSRREKRDSVSSGDQTQSGSDRMKEKVNKIFGKQSNIPFWKK